MNEFLWPIRVYYEDTDAAGVVFYANYLKFMERARTEWLRHLGYEQDRLRTEDGLVFVVTRVVLDFQRPARFNDLLSVSVRLSTRGRASLSLYQEVRDAQRQDLVYCRGEVKLACIDAGSFRPRAIPPRLIAELADDE